MTKDYIVHWILGSLAVIVAFWGNKLAIPSDYVAAAGPLATSIIGHALAYTPDVAPSVTPPNPPAP